MPNRRILSWWGIRIYWDPTELIWTAVNITPYFALYLGHLSIYWWRNRYYWRKPT